MFTHCDIVLKSASLISLLAVGALFLGQNVKSIDRLSSLRWGNGKCDVKKKSLNRVFNFAIDQTDLFDTHHQLLFRRQSFKI